MMTTPMDKYVEKYGHMIGAGETVIVHTPFWFYDTYYESNKIFEMTEGMELHGFEKFVTALGNKKERSR